MIPDARKYAIDEHKRWIGYLQPEGIIVAPVALVDHGVQLDASQFASIQERFLAAVGTDADTGAPVIPSFPHFASAFLGWRDDLLDIFSVDAEVPDALRISTGDYGELLRPDAAYRFFAQTDADRPWMLLIRQLPVGTGFDKIPDDDRAHGWVASPAQKFERLLRATEVPIGLLCNCTEVRLVYAPRGENAGSLTFPVRFMTELPGRAVAAALDMLLSHRRLVGVAEAARLPALLKKSREYQSSVSIALAEQVLETLYELVRGFQAADEKVHNSLLRDVLARDPDEVYHALLTILLRLVFLLFAEDRGLMPGGALYQRGYSIHGLFEKLRTHNERYPDTMDNRFGAWAQILTLCRLVHEGCRHPDLRMPARLGHLFDPDRFPFLEGRANARDDVRGPVNQLPLVSDGILFRVLEKLLLLDGERLSYRTLDVEQIGSVYQTMIGFTLELARGISIALKPANSKGAPAFLDLDALLATEPGKRAEHLQKLTDHKLTGQPAVALKGAQTHDDLLAALERKIARKASPDKVPTGSLILQPTDERRRSGSHYTPRALTEPIVRKTLEPVLARLGENPTPQQILDLKVCDPAVGSGAFLVEACRQLGDALVAAWLYHGGKPVIPPDEDELLHARRLVAQRCLYGLDRNPMATDLAKLSLWLSTLAKDHPFTFLDHSLRSGDSLVGLSKKQIIAFHWDLTAPGAKERQFGQDELERAIQRVTSYRREILEGGDTMLPGLKATRLGLADEALSKIRRAGDLCIAAFFDGDKPKARATLRENYLDALLEAGKGFQPEKIAEVNATVARLRQGTPHSVTPFHWEIEFPEVFGRENGGFDAFVGNPPYGGKNTIIEGNHENYPDWLKMLHEDSHGNADIVAHFFRRAFNLLRRDGTFGLIATNTIRQGDTRHTGLRWICANGGGTIYAARRRYKWAGSAAVTVSVVWILKGTTNAPLELDGESVPLITAYLVRDGGNENPALLDANGGKSFQGCILLGMGFTFDDTDAKGIANPISEMRLLIEKEPLNAERIFPYLGGEEINDNPKHAHHRFAISFANFPLRRSDLGTNWSVSDEQQRTSWLRSGVVPKDYPDAVASDWPDLLDIVKQKVKPERDTQNRDSNRERWWQYGEKRPALMAALRGKNRQLAIPFVAKFHAPVFVPATTIVAGPANVITVETFAAFASIQSSPHELWARTFSSSLEDRQRYTPSDCFETFPFPDGWETDLGLETEGREYYEFRSQLMVRNNQGLTKTYNRVHNPEETDPGIQRLRELHAAMDRAVLAAYGWSDLVEEGRCVCEFIPDYYDEPEQEGGEPIPKSIRYRWPDATREEVLARLLKLNAARAAEEKAAAEPATRVVARPARKPRKIKSATPSVPVLPKAQLQFGMQTLSPVERRLPNELRLTAPQPLLYAVNLVLALLSEAGGSLPWERLLEAYVLATDPQRMRRAAPAEEQAGVAAWAARWNENVTPGLLIESLAQLGGKNLTVTRDNRGRVFHLLDGPRKAATEDVAYDAWLALRLAAELMPNIIEFPEREAWADEIENLAFA